MSPEAIKDVTNNGYIATERQRVFCLELKKKKKKHYVHFLMLLTKLKNNY
jgi:hypothetical protein